MTSDKACALSTLVLGSPRLPVAFGEGGEGQGGCDIRLFKQIICIFHFGYSQQLIDHTLFPEDMWAGDLYCLDFLAPSFSPLFSEAERMNTGEYAGLSRMDYCKLKSITNVMTSC